MNVPSRFATLTYKFPSLFTLPIITLPHRHFLHPVFQRSRVLGKKWVIKVASWLFLKAVILLNDRRP